MASSYVHQNRVGSRRSAGHQRTAGRDRHGEPEQPARSQFPHHAAGISAPGLTSPANFNPIAANITLHAAQHSRRPTCRAGSSACSARCRSNMVIDVGYVGQSLGGTPGHRGLQPGHSATHSDVQSLAAGAPSQSGLRTRSRGSTRPVSPTTTPCRSKWSAASPTACSS